MPVSNRGNLSRDLSRINHRHAYAEERVQFERDLYFETRGWPPLPEWEWAELLAGAPYGPQAYDEDGNERPRGFQRAGQKPEWLTRAIKAEAFRRISEHGAHEMAMKAMEGIGVIGEIMNDPEVDPSTRLNAAKFFIEQVHGKATVRVSAEVKQEAVHILATAMIRPSDDDDAGAPGGSGREVTDVRLTPALEGEIVEPNSD